jgi:hypothetical protein
VGRLRAYGNAIVAQAAEAFIGSFLDAERDQYAHVGGDSCVDDYEALLS